MHFVHDVHSVVQVKGHVLVFPFDGVVDRDNKSLSFGGCAVHGVQEFHMLIEVCLDDGGLIQDAVQQFLRLERLDS